MINAVNFSISSAFSDATNFNKLHFILGFLAGSDGKESASNVGDLGFDCWVGKIPWRRERLPTPVYLPGELLGQRNLMGYSSWGSYNII